MKTKHTQGEWYIESETSINEYGVEGIDISTTANIDNFITVWCGDGEFKKEAEATAKLVSAAPELLESCLEMIRIKDLWIPNDYDHIKEEHRGEAIALVKALRSLEQAIQKATK